MRRKSVLLILALALLLTMGGPAFAEYPGRLAANAMTNLMPEEYAVVENSSTPLHEILHMDRATIEEMMGQEPYYTFWIIEGNRQIGLDDSLSLEPGDEITIEIRNTTGLNHQFKM